LQAATEEDAATFAADETADQSRRLFIIQNPAARTRHPERLRKKIESLLLARGVAFEHAYTDAPGHGSELVADALSRGYRRVLVAGGDGTVREAVSALAGAEAALALLPAGTGNQMAANLGVPKDLKRSLEVALRGRIRTVDLGMINGRPFAAIAGAGIEAEVIRPKSRAKRRFGYLAYVHAATFAALSPKPANLRIGLDGNRSITGRGVGVEVVNMPGLTAPGLPRPVRIVPDGRMDDGQLDGFLVAAETTFECFAAVGSIVFRRFNQNRRLHYFSAREISVEADPPLPVQADGELIGETPFRAKIWPNALKVLVPAG
jgi:YegS/Rv2252/BmrU family lipid kinase